MILLLLFSLKAFACTNYISEKEAVRAIALIPGAGKPCNEKIEKCLCFDGIDWRAAELVNGALQNNPKKLAEVAIQDQLKKQAEADKANEIDSLLLKLKSDSITDVELKNLFKLMFTK